jgi:hypothetical protein
VNWRFPVFPVQNRDPGIGPARSATNGSVIATNGCVID